MKGSLLLVVPTPLTASEQQRQDEGFGGLSSILIILQDLAAYEMEVRLAAPCGASPAQYSTPVDDLLLLANLAKL